MLFIYSSSFIEHNAHANVHTHILCTPSYFRVTFLFNFALLLLHYRQSQQNVTSDLLDELGFGYFSDAVMVFLNCGMLAFLSAIVAIVVSKVAAKSGIGTPSERMTPQEIYEETLEKEQSAATRGNLKWGALKAIVGRPGMGPKIYALSSKLDTLMVNEDASSSRSPDEASDWEEFWDESNECAYYYNSDTGESTWEKPADFLETGEASSSARNVQKRAAPLQVSLPVRRRKARLFDDATTMEDLMNSYASKYVGKWVTEVSVIQNSGKVIRSFREKKSLLTRIERQREKVHKCTEDYEKELTNDGSTETSAKRVNEPLSLPQSKLRYLKRKKNAAVLNLHSLLTRLNDVQWKISNGANPKTISECCGVFVTFEHEESRVRVSELAAAAFLHPHNE